jgi:hypothetical protein
MHEQRGCLPRDQRPRGFSGDAVLNIGRRQVCDLEWMARPDGFEPPTTWFEAGNTHLKKSQFFSVLRTLHCAIGR